MALTRPALARRVERLEAEVRPRQEARRAFREPLARHLAELFGRWENPALSPEEREELEPRVRRVWELLEAGEARAAEREAPNGARRRGAKR